MSSRLSALTVVVAVVLAVLLLGGTATRAAWTDSTGSETTTLTAANLTAQITQTGPTSVEIGTLPGVERQQAAEGLIPGVQGQQWSYDVSNDSSSNVAAYATLRLRGTPQNAADYELLRPFLQGTVEVEGQPESISVPTDSFTPDGFRYDVDLGESLQPGEHLEVTLTFSIPASVEGYPNLAVTLNSLRSTSLDPRSIFTMTNAVYLLMAGDPS